ncbi:MAG: hypothetical protein LUD81_08330 [Clostridiales bacterium]|nr:hypothetical protein [Clostridiales bacterium]
MKDCKKKIANTAASIMVLTLSCCPVFGGETDTSTYYKNSSVVEDLKGKAEFNKKTNITVEDETGGSITTKKVSINTEKISGEGEVVISNKTDTEYKNVSSPVIVDLEIDINSPIIYGDDVDVSIENESETSFENTDAAYIYKYGYSYNNAVVLPYFDSSGQVITGK